MKKNLSFLTKKTRLDLTSKTKGKGNAHFENGYQISWYSSEEVVKINSVPLPSLDDSSSYFQALYINGVGIITSEYRNPGESDQGETFPYYFYSFEYGIEKHLRFCKSLHC